jgi:hypothetical protein
MRPLSSTYITGLLLFKLLLMLLVQSSPLGYGLEEQTAMLSDDPVRRRGLVCTKPETEQEERGELAVLKMEEENRATPRRIYQAQYAENRRKEEARVREREHFQKISLDKVRQKKKTNRDIYGDARTFEERFAEYNPRYINSGEAKQSLPKRKVDSSNEASTSGTKAN